MKAASRTLRFSEASGSTTLPLGASLAEVSVANTAGAIVLRGTDREDVRVSWVKRGDPGAADWDDLALEVETQPDRIAIRPRHPERGAASARIVHSGFTGSAGHGGSWLDIAIEAPRLLSAVAVELACGAGETSAEGIACRSLRLVAASGSAGVRDVIAPTRIQSASGDVSASWVEGDLGIRTAGGDVAVMARHPGSVTVETASGDVRLRAIEPLDAHIRTISGDVRAELAAQHGWRLDVRSVSGKAALPRRFASAGRKMWSAPGTTGLEGSLSARTVSGEFRVTDLAAPSAASPDVPAARSASSREEILRAVERGDLGVEDALRLLDALADGAQPA